MAGGKTGRHSKVLRPSLWSTTQGSASQVVIRQPTALPDRCFVKLRYCQTGVVTVTSGAMQFHAYSGNSVWDPDVTGAGGIANQADYWMGSGTSTTGFYRNYIVHSSSIKVTLNGGGSFAGGVELTVFPHPLSNVPSTSMDTNKSMPYAKTIYCQSNWTKTLKHFMSTNKIEGRPDGSADYALGNFASTFGARPANQWYWQIAMSTFDQASTASFSYAVDLVYYTEMYLRTRQSNS